MGEHELTALHPIASLSEEYSTCLNNTDGLGNEGVVLTTLQGEVRYPFCNSNTLNETQENMLCVILIINITPLLLCNETKERNV